MDSVLKIQRYCNKYIEKVDNQIYNCLKNKDCINRYNKENEKLIKVLSNPKKKNFYFLHLCIFLVKVGTLAKEKEKILNLSFMKLEDLLVKKIIDDLCDKNSKNIFLAFHLLNTIIDEMNLTIKEKLEVYNYVINKNIKNKIHKADVKKLGEIEDEEVDIEHAKRLFYLPNKEKYIKNRYIFKVINKTVKAVRENAVDATDEVIAHDVFKREYNKEHLNEEGLNELLKALRIFNFKEDEIKRINNHYKKINDNKDEKEIHINLDLNLYEKNEKEKNILREELSNYNFTKNNKIDRVLSYEQLKRLVYILKKLKYDNDTIKQIIDQNEVKVASLSTTEKYEYYIALLSFYAEKYGFLQELFELNDSYNNRCIKESKIAKMLHYMPNMKEFMINTVESEIKE